MPKTLINKPFPLAVYGTLRCVPSDQGNASLMFSKKPLKQQRCFIPHFVPSGIWLDFKKNACGVAELFFYDPLDWPSVIKEIDLLEGYNPNNIKESVYLRTLMNVRLIPDDYADYMYFKGISIDNRDLKIPRKKWNFPSIAAWVYSNESANSLCEANMKDFENPIITY